MKKLLLSLIFCLQVFGCYSFATEETAFRRFNLRVSPFIIAIGGNFDFDVYLAPKFTLGPAFFGWGGCGSRQSADGSQCDTWIAYGIRSNYYFDLGNPSHLVYFGPGLYQAKKSISYRYNGQTLEGNVSGLAITALVGYMHQSNGAFNVSAGIGGLQFVNRKSDVNVSNDALSQTISSGHSPQLLFEVDLGWRI